jgi:hypothetical protein
MPGVAAAGLGRHLLANGARRLRSRLSERHRANLNHAQQRLVRRRSSPSVLLGLFVVSPLPSAQLSRAAGPLEFRIVPLTGAFMAGRLVTYSLYLGAATAADSNGVRRCVASGAAMVDCVAGRTSTRARGAAVGVLAERPSDLADVTDSLGVATI